MDGRIRVMGVPIDALTMEQTVDKILGHIERGEPVQHVAINPAKVLRMVEDAEVRRTINQCEVISADGIGFVLACKLLGQPLPERVAGIDLMDGLIEACAELSQENMEQDLEPRWFPHECSLEQSQNLIPEWIKAKLLDPPIKTS